MLIFKDLFLYNMKYFSPNNLVEKTFNRCFTRYSTLHEKAKQIGKKRLHLNIDSEILYVFMLILQCRKKRTCMKLPLLKKQIPTKIIYILVGLSFKLVFCEH